MLLKSLFVFDLGDSPDLPLKFNFTRFYLVESFLVSLGRVQFDFADPLYYLLKLLLLRFGPLLLADRRIQGKCSIFLCSKSSRMRAVFTCRLVVLRFCIQ